MRETYHIHWQVPQSLQYLDWAGATVHRLRLSHVLEAGISHLSNHCSLQGYSDCSQDLETGIEPRDSDVRPTSSSVGLLLATSIFFFLIGHILEG